MTYYTLSTVKDDAHKSINILIQDICKINNINYNKQKYKILFSNEKIYFKNNDIKFTSGSKKYLCFYGKIYLNKKNKIIETIYLDNDLIKIEPEINNILIISGGTDNSTVLECDEELLHFYVAPSSLLEMQDPKTWQTL